MMRKALSTGCGALGLLLLAGVAAQAPLAAAAADGEASAAALMKAPLLEISKSCPNLRYIGRDATFEILVANKGDAAAANVIVTDSLAGVEFVSADNNGQREGNNVVWRLGTLEGGQSRTLKLNVRCNQITTVKNTATVAYCAEAAASCEFPVKGIPAVLLECVDDPDPVEIGGQLNYTITVTNQGSETGTTIAIQCTLPAEQDFVKGSGATEAKAEGKMVRFAPLASLAPRARAVWVLTVKGVKSGDVRFRVDMKTDQLDSPVMETESTRIYE
jgi:uncharacterized repeat protein (TIGR01451 family)